MLCSLPNAQNRKAYWSDSCSIKSLFSQRIFFSFVHFFFFFVIEKECSYIRNPFFVEDHKASGHWWSAKSTKGLGLKHTSLDVAGSQLRAAAALDYGRIVSPWRKPKVIIYIWSFSSRSKWSAWHNFIWEILQAPKMEPRMLWKKDRVKVLWISTPPGVISLMNEGSAGLPLTFGVVLLLYYSPWFYVNATRLKKFQKQMYYLIFVQFRPSVHLVLFQVLTRLGTVPKMVTPASWKYKCNTEINHIWRTI